jgi:hypothetical protein
MSSKPSNKNAYAVEAVDPASLSKIRLRLSNRRGADMRAWLLRVAGYNDIVVLTVPGITPDSRNAALAVQPKQPP